MVLHHNEFIIPFIQIIHKKQTQKYNIFNFIVVYFEKYSSTVQQLTSKGIFTYLKDCNLKVHM